ncbi:MAG: hypothetical protein O7I42_14580 [Alphaproteobacteria bacterium]|nr:hypothetical protein [Alphaproteobacteria bacterium]
MPARHGLGWLNGIGTLPLFGLIGRGLAIRFDHYRGWVAPAEIN